MLVSCFPIEVFLIKIEVDPPPVSPDIFARLKALEDKVLELEANGSVHNLFTFIEASVLFFDFISFACCIF